MSLPLVAIVGRPNVGKSTLYNKFVGGRPALVHDTPGLTRDRRYGVCDYFGQSFRVVDTGGLDPEAEAEVIGAGIHRQAERAIAEAEAIVFVVDGKAGVSPLDAELGQKLRALGKPLLLAVNKIDHPNHDLAVHEFHRLGFLSVFPVSATHGRGVDDLMEQLVAVLELPPPAPTPSEDELRLAEDAREAQAADFDADEEEADEADFDADDGEAEAEAEADEVEAEDDAEAADDGAEDAADAEADGEAEDAAESDSERDRASARMRWPRRAPEAPPEPLRVAFVGRPNAGKSSLCNRLIGEERSLVHHVAGTTTDPVDSELTLGNRRYLLVDTAGIRRKAKVDEEIEKIAVSMALGQIERADVVVLMIDASAGPSEQDARLAGMIEERGKAIVIAINKADLVSSTRQRAELTQAITDNFHFLPWAPVVWLSAARGDGVDRLLDKVDQVAKQFRRRVGTAELNRFFAEVCEAMPPPIWRGKSARVYYLTQGRSEPPTFLLWTNNAMGLPPSYRRFVANRLRERYGFAGTPLRVISKSKSPRDDDRAGRPRTGREDERPVRPPRPGERSLPAKRNAKPGSGARGAAPSRSGAAKAGRPALRGAAPSGGRPKTAKPSRVASARPGGAAPSRSGASPARPGARVAASSGGRPSGGRPAGKPSRPAGKPSRPGARGAAPRRASKR